MEITKAIDQSKQIQNYLSSLCENPQKAVQLINGIGFKSLYASSDFLPAILDLSNLPCFIHDYLVSMAHLNPKVARNLQIFCKNLPIITEAKWYKFQTLFDCELGGKGSWIGVYFRKLSNNKCQFVSNHFSCAFTLMPDVYIFREQSSSSFGPITSVDINLRIVEKQRGFTHNDYQALMNVCTFLTNLKALKQIQTAE